ncbi:MAG: T9SS type B sorting domain-containing protein [Paludibacteraceae bacterium]|nr:T9SS type B sorting domain-containing protein [Paludibacteraceae bacterium]
MSTRTAILLFLSFLLHFQVSAVSLLTIDTEQDKYEEGNTANYSFTYIQTEGSYFPDAIKYADGWDFSGMAISGGKLVAKSNYAGTAAFKQSLAYNSFVSFSAPLSFDNAFVASVRKNMSLGYDASIEFHRGKELSIILYISGSDVTKLTLPFDSNNIRVNIDVKDEVLRVWVNTDTLASPVLVYDKLSRVEGYFLLKNSLFKSNEIKSSGFYDISCRSDYAYGLQFVLNKVDGSYIHDVFKNDNRLLLDEYLVSNELSPNMQALIDSLGVSIPNFKHSTRPPFFSNSTNDDGYWYCDDHPTTMLQPIPYSSIFHIKWQERIDSCGPKLQNKVTVRLFGFDDDAVTAVHSCPCSEKTCFLDSVFISAPASSFCQGEHLELTAELVGEDLDKDAFVYEWSVNNIKIPETADVLSAAVAGNYRVKVTKADDPLCTASSLLFTARADEKPVMNLKDTTGCSGAGVVLTAVSAQNYSPLYTYKWSTGSSERFVKVKESGSYSVKVKNGQCVDSAVAYVEVEPCVLPSLDSLEIQKVVTPNGDGVNDYFYLPVLAERFPKARVSLYNRYGVLLYEKNADEFKWDGTYCGHQLPSADYWYEVYVPGLYRYYLEHVTLLWQ